MGSAIDMGLSNKSNIQRSLGIIQLLFENHTPPPHSRTHACIGYTPEHVSEEEC